MDDQTTNPMPDPNAPAAPQGDQPMDGGQEAPASEGGDTGVDAPASDAPVPGEASAETPAEGGSEGDANQGGSVS